MIVRSKMRLVSITSFSNSSVKELKFSAQYDDKTPETQRFQKYTPSANATYLIDNPVVTDHMIIGADYYVDFIPVIQA